MCQTIQKIKVVGYSTFEPSNIVYANYPMHLIFFFSFYSLETYLEDMIDDIQS